MRKDGMELPDTFFFESVTIEVEHEPEDHTPRPTGLFHQHTRVGMPLYACLHAYPRVQDWRMSSPGAIWTQGSTVTSKTILRR